MLDTSLATKVRQDSFSCLNSVRHPGIAVEMHIDDPPHPISAQQDGGNATFATTSADSSTDGRPLRLGVKNEDPPAPVVAVDSDNKGNGNEHSSDHHQKTLCLLLDAQPPADEGKRRAVVSISIYSHSPGPFGWLLPYQASTSTIHRNRWTPTKVRDECHTVPSKTC